MKSCTWCGLTKSIDEFPKYRHWYSGAEKRRAHCKACEVSRVVAHQRANPAQKAARMARYLHNHLPQHAERQRRRAARRKNQLCSCCTAMQIQEFYAKRPEGYEVDHIVPLARGGLHCLSNLQYMLPADNRRKGARSVEHDH